MRPQRPRTSHGSLCCASPTLHAGRPCPSPVTVAQLLSIINDTAIVDGVRVRVTRVGNKVYSRCHDCDTLVQVNKPVLGSLHMCRSWCELYGHTPVKKRRGPFWRRRTQLRCTRCEEWLPAVSPRAYNS